MQCLPYLCFDGAHAVVVPVDDHVLPQRRYHLIRQHMAAPNQTLGAGTCSCHALTAQRQRRFAQLCTRGRPPSSP